MKALIWMVPLGAAVWTLAVVGLLYLLGVLPA